MDRWKVWIISKQILKKIEVTENAFTVWTEHKSIHEVVLKEAQTT